SKGTRKELVLSSVGILLFLSSFSVTGLIASETGNYNILVYGIFGMPVFLAFLTYLIVKYKSFNIKTIAAQALVVSLIALVGSQFAFINDIASIVLNLITLVLVAIVGSIIIRNVKNEIRARK